MSGVLDIAALEAAFCDLLARHESLRTSSRTRLGVPRQQILEPAAVRLGFRWSRSAAGRCCGGAVVCGGAGVRSVERTAAAGAALCAGADADAAAAPEHVLLLVLHHIAGDGWSLGPLWRDLVGVLRRRGARPPRRGCRAAGAVCRLHAVAARGAGRGERSAERDRAAAVVLAQHLAGSAGSARAAWPTGRARRWPAIAAVRCGLQLPGPLHGGLLALARQHGASLFMVLQAALAGLLSRLGAGTDIAIGTPIGGPHRRGAGRSGRVLRQHVGAAHRPFGRSELRASCWPGCGQAILRPMAIQDCRSSGWWRCSTRRARWRGTRCSR